IVRFVRGEEGFVYGIKERAKQNHCLAYGTFSVEMERLESLRKEYSRAIAPITNVALFLKAAALAVERNPQVNAILFRGWLAPRIVQFRNVDVNLPITRQLGDRWITFIGTVRSVPTKSVVAFQRDLMQYQRCRARAS